MITFLANQVDLLSASINQIQVCVAKVMESFDVKLDTKVQETDMKLQESMAVKEDYLEQKGETTDFGTVSPPQQVQYLIF